MFAGLIAFSVFFAFVAFLLAGTWRFFEKAGEPGWKSIIPFYNLYTIVKISKRSGWGFLFFFIPLLGLIYSVFVGMDIAKRFNQGDGFGLGLGLLPSLFYPLLGFSDAKLVDDNASFRVPDADEYEYDDLSDEREYDIEVEEWPIQRDEF